MSDWLYSWNDPEDRLWADDKVSHWLGGAFAGSLAHTRGMPLTIALGWVLLLAILVEVVEVRRYGLWQARSAPQPWPWLTDKASGKDVLWGILGGLCGWWLADLLRVSL